MDSKRYSTSSTSRKTGTTEERAEPPLSFGLCVELTQDVENGTERAGLEDSKEETTRSKLTKVLGKPHPNGDTSKKEDCHGKPGVRLDIFDTIVGKHLEEHIWHEKYRKGGIELVTFEVKVLDHSVYLGVGDVYPVKKRKEIEKRQWRNHAKVDFPHQFAMGNLLLFSQGLDLSVALFVWHKAHSIFLCFNRQSFFVHADLSNFEGNVGGFI